MRFIQHLGDTGKLPTSKDHINFRWLEKDCLVLFSVTRQGNAASCHFTCDKNGLKKIEQAIDEGCDFFFWLFDWCEMIMAKVNRNNVEPLLKRCGFKKILEGKVSVLIRRR